MDSHTITFELPKVPNNRKLRAIVEQSAQNLISLVADHEDSILRALQETEDGKASLSHAIKLDFGKDKQTDSLSFSIKHSDEIAQAMPDPDQPELWRAEPKQANGSTVDEPPGETLGLPAPVLVLEAEIVGEENGEGEKAPMPEEGDEVPTEAEQPAEDY